jgi:hypothetical protein
VNSRQEILNNNADVSFINSAEKAHFNKLLTVFTSFHTLMFTSLFELLFTSNSNLNYVLIDEYLPFVTLVSFNRKIIIIGTSSQGMKFLLSNTVYFYIT